MNLPPDKSIACPPALTDLRQVLLAHGGGGSLMHQMLDRLIRPAFQNSILDQQGDAAVLEMGATRVAFTTDSYVIQPLIFPGGDIGSLAVNGTVNDLAMMGARPLYLSAAVILEEGLPIETLTQVIGSMKEAAARAGALLVTGDTKVVDRGKGDGLFINTSGLGVIDAALPPMPRRVRAGDVVLLNGDIGRHGIAVMAVREGLSFTTTLTSDSAPLSSLVQRLMTGGVEVHAMRDLTRGGLATGLNEIARTAGVAITIEEAAVPVREDVEGACELLGLDPFYVANEGRMVAFVKAADADRALALMREDPQGRGACRIGTVESAPAGRVAARSAAGPLRILDMLSGEQLPRIC